MIKVHVLAFCCLLFGLQSEVSIQVIGSVSTNQSFVFLQVSTDEASQPQPRFTCDALCDQVDFGFAGICCGK